MSYVQKVIDLVTDATSVYDPTKPYLAGNSTVKTVNSQQAVGAGLTQFIDTFTDFATAPGGAEYYDPATGRLFVVAAPVAPNIDILLYNFNRNTLKGTPVGRVRLAMPNTAATTHIVKELIVDNSGTTGWDIWINTTATVVINGGPFLANKIDLADFAMVGFPTIPFAFNSNDQKAVYKLTTTNQPGVLNNTVSGPINVAVSVGMWKDNTDLGVFNGTSAAVRALHFDTATAPNHTVATVTLTITSPGKVQYVSHPFLANDPVVLATTGALPTGLVAGTVYFVRAVTVNDFEVSATTGGASINFTGAQSGVHTLGRAFGEISSLYSGTSGDISPVLTGTLLTLRNARLKVKPDAPNAGVKFIRFGTSTQLYRIQATQLAAGSVSFTTLETVNVTSAAITGPTPTFVVWDDDPLVNRWLYTTNTAKVVEKLFVNSAITRVFGSLLNKTLENIPMETINFGVPTIFSFSGADGLLFIQSNTTLARGLVVMDYKSDAAFVWSYVLSPVITVNKAVLKSIATNEALFAETGTVQFSYRTSGFGSPTGSFTSTNTAEELSEVMGTQVQFKLAFDIATEDASTSAQLTAVLAGFVPTDQNDEEWVNSFHNSSEVVPSTFAWRLQYAYASGMPAELIADIVDDSDNVIQTFSTITDAAQFSYSTNNGTSWNALGVIPNVALTTELRLIPTSPPGVPCRARLRAV